MAALLPLPRSCGPQRPGDPGQGLLCISGFIDTHTHFDLDTGSAVTADDFVTGTKAAALGGTTCILDFATQERDGSLQQALDTWHEKAQGSSCNYGFHMAIAGGMKASGPK